MEPKESAATSLNDGSCAEDRVHLVPPGFTGGLESAKHLSPTTPQHGQSSSDARGAHQVTTEASGAVGLNLPNSTMEHAQAYDTSTFPISCALKKHALGFYILDGACCLCGQTFRAVGTVCKGKVLPWSCYTRVQKKIIQHARTHGAVGYTPHRNLDKMRLEPPARQPSLTFRHTKAIADTKAEAASGAQYIIGGECVE